MKSDKEQKIAQMNEALKSKEYICSILDKYKKLIYTKLASGEQDTLLLQGQAVMIRLIEDEIEKDIAHGKSAQQSFFKK